MIDIPGYKIIKELGQGGMATVYLAIHIGLDREVAIKVMSPVLTADATFSERFNREAKIVAQLKHPGIVGVYDVGHFNEYHYISMEYHANGDLKQKIKKGLSSAQVIPIIRAVALALDFAHSKGYIHRDIKPENILFDHDNKPVLTDFGIARATNSNTQVTEVGSAIGTPRYMSPEQARGKKTDHRSDLYSLGVLFYEMMTGEAPYVAEDSLAVGIKHVTDPIPSLPEEFSEYQEFLNKIMAKQPTSRFQSGKKIVDALDACSDKHQVQNNDELEPLIAQRDDRAYYPKNQTHTSGTSTVLVPAGKSIWKWMFVPLLPVLVVAFSYLKPGYMPLIDPWVNEISGRAEQQKLEQKRLTETQNKKEKQRNLVENIQKNLKEAKMNLELVDFGEKELLTAENLYRHVEQLQSGHPEVKPGLSLVGEKYLQLAKQSSELNQFDQANKWMSSAMRLIEDTSLYSPIKKQIVADKLVYETSQKELLLKKQQEAKQQKKKEELLKEALEEKNGKIVELMRSAESSAKKYRLTRPVNDNALYYYNEILALDPEYLEAKQGIKKIAGYYLRKTKELIADGKFVLAQQNLDKAVEILPEDSRIEQLSYLLKAGINEQKKKLALNESKENKPAKKEVIEVGVNDKKSEKFKANPLLKLKVNARLQSAKTAFVEGRLAKPSNENAFDKFVSVLAMEPENIKAKEGIKLIISKMTILSQQALADGDELLSNQYSEKAKKLSTIYQSKSKSGNWNDE